jgi:hypothetical protein
MLSTPLICSSIGDGVGQGLGGGARIGRADRDCRWGDLRVLRHRQARIGDGADQNDDDGDHGREHRPVDKEVR